MDVQRLTSLVQVPAVRLLTCQRTHRTLYQETEMTEDFMRRGVAEMERQRSANERQHIGIEEEDEEEEQG